MMNNKQDFFKMFYKLNNRTIFDNIERILMTVLDRYCSIYKSIKSISLDKYNDEKTQLNFLLDDFQEIEYNIYNDDLAYMLLDLFNLIRTDLYNQDLLLDYENENAFIHLTKLDDNTNKMTFKINNKNYEFVISNFRTDITRDLKSKLTNIKPTAVFFS